MSKDECPRPRIGLLEKAVKKAIDAKTKALLKPPFVTRKIDAKYLRGNQSAKKEEKDSRKTKFADTSLLMYLVANTSNFLFTKVILARKTRIREVLGAEVAKKIVAITSLQKVLIPITSTS